MLERVYLPEELATKADPVTERYGQITMSAIGLVLINDAKRVNKQFDAIEAQCFE